jgi:ABC-type Fe2+-enterobactin transport system substrate-binding protein
MNKRLLWFAIAPALLFAGTAAAQYPVLDMVAGKLVQKYQQSSCEQLWQEKAQQKGRPKPEKEQQAVELLRSDPQMRAAFIDKVAAPIASKMFECGMIP